MQQTQRTQRQGHFEGMAAAVAALDTQRETLAQAASLLAQAAQRKALIHVFGVDARAADVQGELFFRAGGLAAINPIYDPALANSHGAYRSELCRGLDGLTPCILDYYEGIEPGDPLVLLTFDPNSTALAQAAQWAHKKELRLLAVLPQPPSDTATAALPEVTLCVGQTHATVCMTAMLNALLAQTVEAAPEAAVWNGSFFPDAAQSEAELAEYLWKIRHL